LGKKDNKAPPPDNKDKQTKKEHNREKSDHADQSEQDGLSMKALIKQ